jgi:hypothetical protein
MKGGGVSKRQHEANERDLLRVVVFVFCVVRHCTDPRAPEGGRPKIEW